MRWDLFAILMLLPWAATFGGSLMAARLRVEGKKGQGALLGFAAGVMIAASMWSLLIPAIEEAEAMGMVGWVPAAGGSVLGIAFLLAMDALLPQLTPESFRHLGRRTPLLVLAVTLHNIPEGMAVGISFALAAQADIALRAVTGRVLTGGVSIVENAPQVRGTSVSGNLAIHCNLE